MENGHMKKIFALLLVALMCVSLLSGCGKSEEEKAREEIESALKEEMGDEAWGELQDEMQEAEEYDKELSERDKDREDYANQSDALRKAYNDAYNAFLNVDYTTVSKDELQAIINDYQEAYNNYSSFLEETDTWSTNCHTELTEAEQNIAFAVQKSISAQNSTMCYVDLETFDYIFIVPDDQTDSSLPYIKGYFVTPENNHIDYDFSNEGYTSINFIAQTPNIVVIEYNSAEAYFKQATVDLSSGTPVFIDNIDSSSPYNLYTTQNFNSLNGKLLNQ